MIILTKCLCEDIYRIVIWVYIGVVNYFANVQILTIVITSMDEVSTSPSDCRDDESERLLTVKAIWQWGYVCLKIVDIIMQLR